MPIALLLGETMTQDLKLALEVYNKVGIEEPKLKQLEEDIEQIECIDYLSLESAIQLAERGYGIALNHAGYQLFKRYCKQASEADLIKARNYFKRGCKLNNASAIANLNDLMETCDEYNTREEESMEPIARSLPK